MPYDTLRNSVREILKGIEETNGYSGRLIIDEHPWGSWDMMTVSVSRDERVVAAFILSFNPGNEPYPTLDVDRVDMVNFSRTVATQFTLNEVEEVAMGPQMVSFALFALLGKHLGPTAAEVAHKRMAEDLDARMKAARPSRRAGCLPAGEGEFDLVLYGLTANDVLRAFEALPDAKQRPEPRTAFDHLLADEL